MHGVRLVRTPPTKISGSALSGFPERLGSTEVRSTKMKAIGRDKFLILAALAAAGLAALSATAGAQDDHHMGDVSHVELSPSRIATPADSARARAVVEKLRAAIAKYRDTTAAVRDGYQMFLPGLKEQKVYHFTNNRRAIKEAFRFDAAQPTSLLYEKGRDGRFELLGAMYTMPKNTKPDRLNDRIPLGVARWHKHVNWCLPKNNEQGRFAERTPDGKPKFGPES